MDFANYIFDRFFLLPIFIFFFSKFDHKIGTGASARVCLWKSLRIFPLFVYANQRKQKKTLRTHFYFFKYSLCFIARYDILDCLHNSVFAITVTFYFEQISSHFKFFFSRSKNDQRKKNEFFVVTQEKIMCFIFFLLNWSFFSGGQSVFCVVKCMLHFELLWNLFFCKSSFLICGTKRTRKLYSRIDYKQTPKQKLCDWARARAF